MLVHATTNTSDAVEDEEQAIRDRVVRLEELLGSPDDPGRPWSDAEVLAADDEARFVPGGEALLGSAGVNAEFVPAALGGRLTRLDGLVRVVRPVFRRDVTDSPARWPW